VAKRSPSQLLLSSEYLYEIQDGFDGETIDQIRKYCGLVKHCRPSGRVRQHVDYGEVQTAHADTEPNIGPIANVKPLKGHYFQPSLSVCLWSIIFCVCVSYVL